MSMKIQSNIHDYEIHFTETLDFLQGFKQFPQRCYIIDNNVWKLYSKRFLDVLDKSEVIVLPVEEDRKQLDTVQELYDQLIVHSARRNLAMISIGGGITQDITGFAASTLYRGINWIFVPTTLLAQADSCIGSKTSLNYKGYKNLLGTFYPPSEVIIHIPFLATQEDKDFYSGLGEVVKLHIIGGEEKTLEIAELMPKIKQREPAALLIAVQNSLLIKQGYISGDEFDTGRRNLLNFGHCFGHALESTSEFQIPHGQAVVIGMLFANIVASERHVLSKEMQMHFAEKLLLPILITKPEKKHLDSIAVVEAMRKDKKQTGEGLVLIMLKDGYEMVKVNNLTPLEISHALDTLRMIFNAI
jgi:3-dehydroquinate synthase